MLTGWCGAATMTDVAIVRTIEDVKLICGIITADPARLESIRDSLTHKLGAIDIVSPVMPFDLTHYYDNEMGSPLWKQFVSFERAVQPDTLSSAKHITNDIEAEMAASSSSNCNRPVNLDPGYLEESKLVLASMKNFSHRTYQTNGVYCEVTLMYRHGKWCKLPWTFPDYASGRYDDFLTQVRTVLRQNKTR